VALSTRRDVREALELAQSNHRRLHGKRGEGRTLIMATPNASVDLLTDVLAIIYDLGDREIRLVTGLPETVHRPVLGPLTRIVVQASTVALATDEDLGPREATPTITVPGGLRRYRDLLDRVLAGPHASAPPVLLLTTQAARHWHGWVE
jgi:hypothetical protein